MSFEERETELEWRERQKLLDRAAIGVAAYAGIGVGVLMFVVFGILGVGRA